MKMLAAGLCMLLSALTTHGHALNSASSCESLSSLALPNTSMTLAQLVPAGTFALPVAGPATPQFRQLPGFCRVAATLTPSSDSAIKIELWLPIADWNGKFQAVGNGGLAGSITYDWLAAALQEGYATASTDTRPRKCKRVRSLSRVAPPAGGRPDGGTALPGRFRWHHRWRSSE
jgi:tannase/feruloyl esterase